MCIRQVTVLMCVFLSAMIDIRSTADAQNSKIDIFVSLRVENATELHLSIDQDCLVSLVGSAPTYEAASIDALCVLKHGPAPSPAITRAIFQVHGYFPSTKAPDQEKPFSITDEDRKLLDTLGPDPDHTSIDYPMKGQVTIWSRMDDVESKNLPGDESYWSADTTWFKSAAIRSLPMQCTTQWVRESGAPDFEPRMSQCTDFLNFHDIEVVAIVDLNAAITPDELEFILRAFEEAAVQK
jgi:hypothetical protein